MDLGPQRIALHDIGPRIGSPLLVTERHPLGLRIELQDHHFNLVADIEVLRRMVHPPPGDIGDVQEPIDAAQIDEDAVVGDVFHHSAGDRSFLQAAEGRRLLLLVLHLHDGAL